MSVEVILAFEAGPDAGSPRETVRIRPDVPIAQCISDLLERKQRDSPKSTCSEDRVEYGIFAVGPKMAWLSPRQPVSSYDISDQVRSENLLKSNSDVVFYVRIRRFMANKISIFWISCRVGTLWAPVLLENSLEKL